MSLLKFIIDLHFSWFSRFAFYWNPHQLTRPKTSPDIEYVDGEQDTRHHIITAIITMTTLSWMELSHEATL